MPILSLVQPRTEIAVPAQALNRPPKSLFLTLGRIRNPAGRAFSIKVELSGPSQSPIRLGEVAPFPVDHGGVFVLPWAEVVRRVRPRGSLRISLTLRSLLVSATGDVSAEVVVGWTSAG